MDKILLIIGREYWVRVKKKSFLIVTFLVPLLIAGMYGLIFYLMLNQTKLETPKKIQVIDPSNLFSKDLKNTEKIQFTPALKQDLLETEKNFKKENIDFILFIPPIKDIALGAMDGEALTPKGIQLIGDKEASIGILGSINDQLEKILRNRSYIEAGIDTAKMNRIKPNVQISTSILTETGEKKSNSFSSYGIGFISSLLI
jgi:ABC-2 type transport system permease protein